MLLAATGVGGGDLATGSFAGSIVGTAVLWAVLVGAFMKFVVTEGLARWQLATGDSFLEGVAHHLGPGVIWVFLPYLFVWSFFVGAAQISACGVAMHALFPVFDDPVHGKIFFGILSSVVGLVLVSRGGYRLFEKVMRVSISVMFVTVVLTALRLWPGTGEVLRGLFVPNIAELSGDSLVWTVALIGGVGGTLTVLCYGYWIREEGRTGVEDLWICRVDLGVGYAMTAVFGIAMVIVGSHVQIEGAGATLLVELAEALEGPIGPVGKWMFLIGAWGTVFSSLLGVWQAVPYLFADCWRLTRRGPARSQPARVDTQALPYRSFLVLIALVPMIGLFMGFQQVQKIYTVSGALFFPFLALALLILNGRAAWVGERFKSRPITSVVLLGVLAFFSRIAVKTVWGI
ncbi:MAG: iron transporter [Gammaproteobacteria bacterium]|nr:MAG: iron transporter [Gammaproteobacteria bacterium]TDJ46395.1 MAG: iron transporter [Gammaproteobacteria bacterium]